MKQNSFYTIQTVKYLFSISILKSQQGNKKKSVKTHRFISQTLFSIEIKKKVFCHFWRYARAYARIWSLRPWMQVVFQVNMKYLGYMCEKI